MSQNIQPPLALPAPASKKEMSFSLFNIWHKPRSPYAEKVTRRAIKEMHSIIKQKYQNATGLQHRLPPDSNRIDDLGEAIKKYRLVFLSLSGLLKNARIFPDQAHACLQNLREQIVIELSEHKDEHLFLQENLNHILEIINTYDQEIAQVLPNPETKAILVTGKPTILVPADLLFQIYRSLFPAERMVVISGRRTGSTVTLGAAFDVTGVANGGYVSANPDLLATALISMDLSATYLAAWVHSHPGQGIQSTFPSAIDLHQHAEWIRNYSPHLLSGIIVQDGYIRFWGTALEAGELSLNIQVPGLTQESANETVYRLIN